MHVRLVSVEHYREQANRLRVDAENICDLTTRNELRDMARRYDTLADGVERMFNHLSKLPTLQAHRCHPPPDDRKP